MHKYKIIRSDELYHHGRLGQKWGVLNGPPYPLDRQTVKEAYGGSKSSYQKRLMNDDSRKRNIRPWRSSMVFCKSLEVFIYG